jgi:hypothetical protein
VTIRVQVLLEEEEKELFAQEAQRAGMSLSAWIREAGKERLKSRPARLKLETPDDLRAFFASCDSRNEGREPDWEEHLRVLERSKLGQAAES